MTVRPRPDHDRLIEKIATQLVAGAHIDCPLPSGGILHIDRQLPHICVHRHRAGDPDTGALLEGLAVYLKTDAAEDPDRLLQTIVSSGAEQFGGFLILELWRGDPHSGSIDHRPAPGFVVHAPLNNAPNQVLDTLVNSLQEVTLRNQTADVSVRFGERCAPPGMAPLFSLEECTELGCVLLGLAVNPVYQDEAGNRLPFAFEKLHRGLTHALKKTLYAFSCHETVSRPAHYHELGPHALTELVWEVDESLAGISESFDLLLHVTPVNAAQAWAQFEQGRFQQEPEFHYRPRSADPALLKRDLYHVPIERIGDPTMAELFKTKRDELDRQLTLLNDRGNQAFLHGSIQLFGRIDRPLLDKALAIASLPARSETYRDEPLSAEQLVRCAEQELMHYRDMDPSLRSRVELRGDITGILVSQGNFLVGSDARVARDRLDATLNHEIGTHALTYHNGRQQLLHQLYAGMAGYEELQEGLAILAEYLSGGLTLARLQLLAGRVIAVDNICNGASFVECFHSLHESHGFRAFTAYNMTMRVYRGGGYTKDMIYLRGFIALLDYISRDEDLHVLYSGKIALQHIHLLQELRWRRVLKPLSLIPRFLTDRPCKDRLDALREQPDIEHILENL